MNVPTFSVHLHCTACGGAGVFDGGPCHCFLPSRATMNGPQIAQAWDMWRESDEGRTCRDMESLAQTRQVVSARAEFYLDNRLWRAFMAGIKAAEAASREEA
jgi:hypothetical protein